MKSIKHLLSVALAVLLVWYGYNYKKPRRLLWTYPERRF